MQPVAENCIIYRMRLVEFVPPTPHPLWKLCPQMGITDVIVKVNPDLTGLPDPWKYETLSKIVGRLKDAGLTVVGLEGDPFDMSPIKEYGASEFLTGFTRFTGLKELGALHPALSSPTATSLDPLRPCGFASLRRPDAFGTGESRSGDTFPVAGLLDLGPRTSGARSAVSATQKNFPNPIDA